MAQRILIMGLPGSGKTTLARELKAQLEAAGKVVGWLNADEIREQYNDWDFSETGRNRQAKRMRELADKLTAYGYIDLVVVPSYSESFGLVALEAQACGTPVVATAVGGLRTAVADGISGVLVDGHDPKAWSSVITRLLQEPQRRVLLSMGAIEHASHFGWDGTARGTLDIYDVVISGARKSLEA